ncbi:hypothetical protein OG792_16525 [Micromonospora sp. NBC_01699]|uniref:hypothetical protein n=1 Tax=Micromonospora sp. NBC_01699 TaxID=2975984 RepID=UPI002E35DF23|nr:hypothetical protein [Micromonospora sp. NBC_01699]
MSDIDRALAALDDFLGALNSHDVGAWADTLHYPHIRVQEGVVTVWPDRDDYVKRSEPELALLLATGWRRSVWESVEALPSTPDQVHVRTRFARLDERGGRLAAFESIYVLTRQVDRWGTVARLGFELPAA